MTLSQTPKDPESGMIPRDYLAFKIFGVGGAGGHAVKYLAASPVPGATFIVVNTDSQALAACGVPHQLQLGAQQLRGLGTGGEPELGWAVAEKEAEALRQHCIGAEVVMVIAGMGGGTGAGASPVLARVARECGALVLAFAILPFDFEGVRRKQQAQQGLEQLRSSADGVICLPNQRLFQLLDGHTSAIDAYRFANDLLARAVHCLWHLLTCPALIRVDLSDLRRLLQDGASRGLFAAGSGQGASRSTDAVEALLASPLLEEGRAFSQANAALISIVGGPDLTMTEVDGIIEKINRHNDGLQVVLGAAIDETHAGRVEIALFLFSSESESIGPEGAGSASGACATPQLSQPQLPVPADPESDTPLFGETPVPSPSPLVPPPPALTQERAELLIRRQTASPSRSRKMVNKMRQGQLPLEIVSKGRFEKSEPTTHKGEDLDLPTFIRKRVPLN